MYLRRISYWIAVLAICVGLAGCAGRHDIMLADFEGQDFGDWEVTGECFGNGPAHGPLGDQAEVRGFEGKRFLNTYHGGDKTEGIMTSPEFVIERDYLNFLIGGGNTGEDGPLKPIDGKIKLQILVDRTSLEVFGNNGLFSMSSCMLPEDDNKPLAVFWANLLKLSVWELNSAWILQRLADMTIMKPPERTRAQMMTLFAIGSDDASEN